MNREIKFRGKSKKTRKWLYGYLGESKFSILDYVYTDKVIFDNVLSFNTDNSAYVVKDLSVYEETIGQFTGLQDKNGKEIYEGDIVKWNRDGMLYLVKFESGMFYASIHEFKKNVYGGFPLHALTDSEDDNYKCEVIGNIFDNPELG